MIRLISFSLLALALIGGGVFYRYFYPPVVLRHATQEAFEDMEKVVATKDRALIATQIGQFLSPGATISLEVRFFSIVQSNEVPGKSQFFSRSEFIHFVDTLLYSLSDYSAEFEIKRFDLVPDATSAEVEFRSKHWADGHNHYGGIAVATRFSIETECAGKLLFSGRSAYLHHTKCQVDLRSVPKPGEASKIQSNPEALKSLIR